MKEEQKQKIRDGIQATRQKRLGQICKVYELKVDESCLNVKQKETLKMLFVEAKWFYNFLITNSNKIFDDKSAYKIKEVIVFDKDKNEVKKEIKFLSARYRQNILYQIQQSIFMLLTKKKRGQKVGKLKFKSDFTTLELSQYGHRQTHEVTGKNKFRVLGIRKHLVVNGLNQIPNVVEYANAQLIKKVSGYYIHITTYSYPVGGVDNVKRSDVGLDFGIKNTLTTSDGRVFEKISIGETDRLKRLQRKFARSQKGSNNRMKIRRLIQVEYEKITNRKHDKANKIVHELLENYSNVYIQSDNFSAWRSWFGKEIQHSCLGLIKSKLLESNRVHIIDRFIPTTKLCYKCGTINDISLNERVFICIECGHTEDRDIKAAKTILLIGRESNIPTVRRDSKLVETQPNSRCVYETRRYDDQKSY